MWEAAVPWSPSLPLQNYLFLPLARPSCIPESIAECSSQHPSSAHEQVSQCLCDCPDLQPVWSRSAPRPAPLSLRESEFRVGGVVPGHHVWGLLLTLLPEAPQAGTSFCGSLNESLRLGICNDIISRGGQGRVLSSWVACRKELPTSDRVRGDPGPEGGAEI